MKIHFDIDCTPEEARKFLGLPDVSAMQADVVAKLRERLLTNIEGMEPEALLKTWMPAGVEGWEKMVKGFWDQMGAAPTDKKKS
ncbi:MAG: DUF6489 family protein [Proteobacteria bacterium]|nr:DUF6489 family protein [Pseudomonadota bacterium]MDA1057853.1 DUF6489 family protein [Pseudomonadota bacterium]